MKLLGTEPGTEQKKTKEQLETEAIHGLTGVSLTGILSRIVRDIINMGFPVDEHAALSTAKDTYDTTVRETRENHMRVMERTASSNEPPDVKKKFLDQHYTWLVEQFTKIGVPETTAEEIVDGYILKEK